MARRPPEASKHRCTDWRAVDADLLRRRSRRRRCCRPGEIGFFGNCGRSPMSSRPVAGLTDEAPAASAMRFTSLVDGGGFVPEQEEVT